MSSNVSQALSPALLLLLTLTACTKAPKGPPPRYAFAPFENLTGDPSLDWVGRATEVVLISTLRDSLAGPVLSAAALDRAAGNGVSGTRAKAALAGASHLVTGYLERFNGKLRLYAKDEDLNSHAIVRNLTAEAAQPLPAIEQLAHDFSAKPGSQATPNQEALKLYCYALNEPLDKALPDMRQATRADPNFGLAWIALVDLTGVSGDRAATLAVVTEALSHKIQPPELAEIRIQKATLENDNPARLAAMRELSAATPGDLALVKTLAESELTAGLYAQSAGDWKKLRDALPSDRDAWNQMGYAIAWSGDYQGAIRAFNEYAAHAPDDANAIDSNGDVHFMYGKFAEAAALYLKANEKGPQLLNGGDLYKAARAQFRAGDLKKADASFEQFRAARTKAGATAGLALFQADWLYCTGREKEAFALLRKESASAPPQTASGLWSQLVIWDLLANDRAAAMKDSAIEAKMPPSNISTIARFAALPSASAGEWESRAEQLLRGPGIESARRYTLAIALLLDGKKEAARPVWEKVAETAPGTDFFSRAVAAKLRGEKPKFELVPDSVTVNQLGALPDKL